MKPGKCVCVSFFFEGVILFHVVSHLFHCVSGWVRVCVLEGVLLLCVCMPALPPSFQRKGSHAMAHSGDLLFRAKRVELSPDTGDFRWEGPTTGNMVIAPSPGQEASVDGSLSATTSLQSPLVQADEVRSAAGSNTSSLTLNGQSGEVIFSSAQLTLPGWCLCSPSSSKTCRGGFLSVARRKRTGPEQRRGLGASPWRLFLGSGDWIPDEHRFGDYPLCHRHLHPVFRDQYLVSEQVSSFASLLFSPFLPHLHVRRFLSLFSCLASLVSLLFFCLLFPVSLLLSLLCGLLSDKKPLLAGFFSSSTGEITLGSSLRRTTGDFALITDSGNVVLQPSTSIVRFLFFSFALFFSSASFSPGSPCAQCCGQPPGGVLFPHTGFQQRLCAAVSRCCHLQCGGQHQHASGQPGRRLTLHHRLCQQRPLLGARLGHPLHHRQHLECHRCLFRADSSRCAFPGAPVGGGVPGGEHSDQHRGRFSAAKRHGK